MSAQRQYERFLWRWCYAIGRSRGMTSRQADNYARRERRRILKENNRKLTLETYDLAREAAE